MHEHKEELGECFLHCCIPVKKINLPSNLTGPFSHSWHQSSYTNNPLSQNIRETTALGTVIWHKALVCCETSWSPTCSASQHYGMSMATGKKCVVQVQKGLEVAATCLWTKICLMPVVTGSSTKAGLSLQAVRGSCGPIKHQGGSVAACRETHSSSLKLPLGSHNTDARMQQGSPLLRW